MAEDAVRLAATDNHLQVVDLELISVDTSAASVLPAAVARRHHVVPIGRRYGTPVVAMADPNDVMAFDTLRATLGRDFIAVVSPAFQIEQCLNRVYGDESTTEPARSPSAAATDHGANGSVATQPAAAQPAATEPAAAQTAATQPAATQAAAAEPAVNGSAGKDSAGRDSAAKDSATKGSAGKGSAGKGSGKGSAAKGATATEPAATKPAANDSEPAEPVEAVAKDQVATEPRSGDSVETDTDGAATDSDTDSAAPTDAPTGPSGTASSAPSPLEKALANSGAMVGPSSSVGSPVGQPHDAEEDPDEVAASLGNDLPPLARVLVEGGRVPLETMQEVLEERDRTGQGITRILTARGLVTEADLMWGMAEEMGIEFVDLDVHNVDLGGAYALPEATARHHNVLLIGYAENGSPIVAASNPTDVFAMDDLRTILGRHFITVVATRSQINSYLDKAYSQGGDASEIANTAASDFDDTEDDLASLHSVVDDAPIVRYVNLLILQAINERASDIHVEPTAENLRIRYRIDGVLHDTSTAPKAISAAVTTRLKVMADVNIAEHRIPQDGRISLVVGSRQIDLRMATLPTIYGEKIVMRVLDKSNVVLGFEDLGFDEDLLSVYQNVFTKPYGTILVTGPTGSGKTTTLYATLSALNTVDRNIITVEDPVELRIKGINQVQLNVKAGLTFASALRSILRADPDILLVGEIRDKETAVIAVEAALTGHLVLATLHTNDAAATPMRLVEMGLEPYLVTSALSAAVAQRLARRLCVHCREPFEATEAEITSAGWSPEEVFAQADQPVLYRAVGCSACSKTGYRGRKALLELLVVTEEIERLIIEGGSADDIHKMAVEQGMVTLRMSGLRKALEGETTLEEVLRVVA